MYYFGLVFYVLTIISYFLFPAVNNLVNQSAFLAPQIVYTCAFLYFFPAVIFSCHLVFKLKSRKYYSLLSTQTKLAASVAVSLGLIGTFIGLTDMVSAIAGSLGGEGDVTAKMGAMITSISSAMSAMAFAFLTSIIGVSVSVLLLVSLNFWEFYYESEKNPSRKSTKSAECDSELQSLLCRMETMEAINTNIASKLVCVPENSKLAELLVENNNVMLRYLIEISGSISRLNEVHQESLSFVNVSLEHVSTSLDRIATNSNVINKSLEHVLISLDAISDNGVVLNEKMALNLEQLVILNTDMNSLISTYKNNNNLKEYMDSLKLDKLTTIITNQEGYIQQNNNFKNKMKTIVEVLGNEG